ncbi:MAG: type II secretion system major pseudopilin GspG [Spirochaetes bacterium]|nr:type II secretion system major pseudopilin GspG [Spirochaetota bacterium]
MIIQKIRLIGSRAGSNRGFTLIEIMIVVTIIALLSAVVIVPNVTKSLSRAKVQAVKIQIQNLQMPLTLYNQDHGNYPTTDEGLSALVSDKLAKEKDIKDPWGNALQYRFPGESDPEEYEIWSLGADGKEGGEGFNADITSWEGK